MADLHIKHVRNVETPSRMLVAKLCTLSEYLLHLSVILPAAASACPCQRVCSAPPVPVYSRHRHEDRYIALQHLLVLLQQPAEHMTQRRVPPDAQTQHQQQKPLTTPPPPATHFLMASWSRASRASCICFVSLRSCSTCFDARSSKRLKQQWQRARANVTRARRAPVRLLRAGLQLDGGVEKSVYLRPAAGVLGLVVEVEEERAGDRCRAVLRT